MSAFQIVCISSLDYEDTDRAIINLSSTTLDRETAAQCLRLAGKWEDLKTFHWEACDIVIKKDTAILSTADYVYYVWLI